jgi:hypothetical protein
MARGIFEHGFAAMVATGLGVCVGSVRVGVGVRDALEIGVDGMTF